MAYFDLTTQDDTTPKAVAVRDERSPGVRLTIGPLYVSMTVPECVEVLEVLIVALAELDAQPKLLRCNESKIREVAEVRESRHDRH